MFIQRYWLPRYDKLPLPYSTLHKMETHILVVVIHIVRNNVNRITIGWFYFVYYYVITIPIDARIYVVFSHVYI